MTWDCFFSVIDRPLAQQDLNAVKKAKAVSQPVKVVGERHVFTPTTFLQARFMTMALTFITDLHLPLLIHLSMDGKRLGWPTPVLARDWNSRVHNRERCKAKCPSNFWPRSTNVRYNKGKELNKFGLYFCGTFD